MRHLAAYLLLVAGGNATPSAGDVSALLATVGVETSEERLSSLITELEGKNVNELIALGREKLVATGGGGAPAAAGGAAPSGAAPAAGAAAPAKKEEKPKEEEVDALDGGMDMFGGGGGGEKSGDY